MSLRGGLDKIPRARPGQKLWTAAQFNALVDAVRTSLNITGPSVIVDSSGTYIGVKRSRVERRWPGRVIAKADLAPNQWIYSVDEVIKKTPGYGGWDIKTNGRQVQCFGMAEDNNSDAGIQGTGINLNNLTGDFEHQPVPVGSLVWVTEVRLPPDPSPPPPPEGLGRPTASATVEMLL